VNSVVPFSMEGLGHQVDMSPLLVCDALALGRGAFIEPARPRQPCLGGRCTNQLDNDLMGHYGFTPPVLADERAQPMLALGPLTRPRRQLTHLDRQRPLISQFLPFHVPQPHPIPVAPAPLGDDQSRARLGIPGLTPLVPPGADRLDRQLGRIMTEAHPHPGLVRRQVKHPSGHGLGLVRLRKGLDIPSLRVMPRPQCAPRVLVRPPPCLLLRVHGHRRPLGLQRLAYALMDGLKRRLAIRVLRAFSTLVVALQTLTELFE
jgi:hypothetical protein